MNWLPGMGQLNRKSESRMDTTVKLSPRIGLCHLHALSKWRLPYVIPPRLAPGLDRAHRGEKYSQFNPSGA